ncbi:MAG: efflux RND transporter periplasmic adaptor subunit [Verrucomicrobia bacterium]|nr:efflux RND transporter periplasmic adaptor subunit [Verrucomicrobiota bacterium]
MKSPGFVPLLLLALAVLGGSSLLLSGCKHEQTAAIEGGSEQKTLYTCGMHPQVIKDQPGNCPICGMKLTPIKRATTAPGGSGARRIKYYKSTMMPGEVRQSPGKDSMGMDLVPVYEQEAAAAQSAAIAIDPVTVQDMGIRTAVVTRGPLRRVVRTVAVIDYNETTLADVTTKFKGWIEKLYVNATGDLVMRGDPLFEIYSPELYSAEVEYLLALGSATRGDSGSEGLRTSALTKLKYFDISDEQIGELEKTRQPRKTLRILAPQAGFVIQKKVVEGQMVDAGMMIYQLADLGLVWAQAEIYEQDLPYLKLGQEATVTLAYLPDREFRGRVTYIYPYLDEKTRTVRVRMEFHNPGYFLKPGMFAAVQIVSELEPAALLLPNMAVLRSGERNTVFVALAGGKFEPRTVVLGPQAEGDRFQVLSGLKEGERVVTSGQFMLDSESQLREAIQKMLEPNEPAPTEHAGHAGPGGPGAPLMARQGGAVGPGSEATNLVKYICPMPEHISIEYDHPGKCSICGMTLIPVSQTTLRKLQPGGKLLYYTCPMPEHSDVHSDRPGSCPKCGMTLIPVMAAPAPAQPRSPTPAGGRPMPEGMVMPDRPR